MDWRNRIVEYGTKRADQFQANPSNWRKHPLRQRQALSTSLATVGWVAPVIENARTGQLVDGHERIWQALDQGDDTPVPFVSVDLSPDEEALILATLDPIGAMAETDREMLSALLAELAESEIAVGDDVEALLREVGADTGTIAPDFAPVDADEQPRLDQKSPVVCPHCGAEFVPNA